MEKNTKFIIDELRKLTAIDSPSGFTGKAAEYTVKRLEKMGFAPCITQKGCVLCCIGGESEGNPLVLSAHLDTLGCMVASIKSNGRLKLTNIGGMNPNNAECENARVYTRNGNVYEGCFQMNDPSIHVNGKYSEQKRSFDEMELVLDEKVFSEKDTKALGIETGNYVCFDPRTVVTKSGYIKSRFLDDKLSVAVLLGLAKLISDGELRLKRKVYIYITVFEEVGHGCSSGIPSDAAEIMSVDMGCVGIGLECKEHQVSICAKDSAGPYNYEVVSKLAELAKKHGLDYAVDVYPHYGSDADAALKAGYDLKHGLIGAGVYASHGYERSHIDGVKNTLELIKAYITE